MRLFHFFPLAAMTFIFGLSSCQPNDYTDPTLSAEKRAKALLKQMTIEEKVGQTLCPTGWPMYEKVSSDSTLLSDRYMDFIDNQHGGMLWATFRADPWTKKTLMTGLNPYLAARTYNELQRYAIENSRLGIPIILAEEAPHGHMAIGTTVFPTGIGLASTWNTELLEEVGRVVAEELRAQGAHISYGPVIDLAREPRWSRVEETFGEDVYLVSQLASAMVCGLSPKHNGYENGVIATPKHFIAYGIPEGGHNANPSMVGERDLYENFLPPFKATFDAGALSVMTAYNSIDGVPSTANEELLRGLLREEWGFEGFVVSDLNSVDGLSGSHRIALDRKEAGIMALKAGVDVDLGANCFKTITEAVKEGRIDEKLLDDAAGRVLKLKFELGLFDNPYVDPDEVIRRVRTSEHIETARRAACESVILLKNDGTLPLSKDKKVAVIGPNADMMYNQLGDYTAPQEASNVVTMLEGIRTVVGDKNVTYVKGCAIRDTDHSNVEAAVQAAQNADVSVVVVGGSSARDFETTYLETGAAQVKEDAVSDMESGEGYDRATLTLLGDQQKLLEAVRKLGKPMVVVYIEGRPLDKLWASENANALLTLWYPGQEGGNALADVLFGEYNPAGRLVVSVPRSVGQLPVYYNKKYPRGGNYVDEMNAPLYPFGYGLSYTDFTYSNMQITQNGSDVSVTFDIANSGSMDGDEVVQLYLTDMKASVVRPQKQLRAFDRIHVKVGETAKVEFTLDEEDFSLYNKDMEKVMEPGVWNVAVGASSADIRLNERIEIGESDEEIVEPRMQRRPPPSGD